MAPALSFPIIDMGLLAGEERPAAMELLRDACENWGFFEVDDVPHLMEGGLIQLRPGTRTNN